MSLKIIHTADWHLGKRLYECDLSKDHELFTSWLLSLIKEKQIDYLVISGDVFDLANPSQESLRLYYKFLAELSATGCAAIITAGNHDSPGLIDAPSHLLDALKITVVGNAPENPDELLVLLKNKKGEAEACLAAVPFLRDKDIRKVTEGESYQDRIKTVREGIGKYYFRVAEAMQQKYSKLPHIALGHLYVEGAETSESEREIQIGNQAGVNEKLFPDGFCYFALGHIHKAQDVGKTGKIRYSGSPVPLSFSEKEYKHKIILLELNGKDLNQTDIPVPAFRKLKSFKGTFEEICLMVNETINDCELPLLIDLEIVEEVYNPGMIRQVEELIALLAVEGTKEIANYRIKYTQTADKLADPENMKVDLSVLSPVKIFSTLISRRDENEQQELLKIFHEIRQQAEEESL